MSERAWWELLLLGLGSFWLGTLLIGLLIAALTFLERGPERKK